MEPVHALVAEELARRTAVVHRRDADSPMRPHRRPGLLRRAAGYFS